MSRCDAPKNEDRGAAFRENQANCRLPYSFLRMSYDSTEQMSPGFKTPTQAGRISKSQQI
jgi:hypothetical protein